jgi:D-alanyl-D-alanine carboxypeptidase/D-alanyl-D-alanine-endopeptidase (penicillin-binding protein 4)
MYYDFSVRAEYVASLGIMGIDGSLKKRLSAFQKRRYIRAKTGTLNGTNTLSGYVGAEGGEELAFSMLMNSRKCNWDNNTKIQNSIVEKLAKFSRTKIENTMLTNTGDKQLAITPQISYNALQ